MSVPRSAACWLLAAMFLGPLHAARALRQSFELYVPVAPAPVVVAGAPYLVYELHLTNFAAEALAPVQLRVRDSASRGVLFEAGGQALRARLGGPGYRPDTAGSADVARGARIAIYLEIPLAAGRVPGTLEHELEYEFAAAGTRARAKVVGGRVAVRGNAPVILGPPLRGGPWVAIHSPDWERGHRRVFYAVDGRARIPGRYAIDFMKLDADGRTARGDGAKVVDWLGYGEDVLAVQDAVVAAVRDDVAESADAKDNPKHPLEDASGNTVVLDLGKGRYAFYEHLKPGSIRVARGDKVRRGQVIAALGFTGDSTGPHLHFHVADGISPLGSEGLPFAFEEFTQQGRYEEIEALGSAPWQPLSRDAQAQHRREHPGSNVVVEFPPLSSD